VCVCVCVCVPAETLAVMQPGCMTDNLMVKLPHRVSLCKKMKLIWWRLPIQLTAKCATSVTLTDKSKGIMPSLPGTPN